MLNRGRYHMEHIGNQVLFKCDHSGYIMLQAFPVLIDTPSLPGTLPSLLTCISNGHSTPYLS